MRKLLFFLLAVLAPLDCLGGTISGKIQTATSGPIANGTLTFTLSQAAVQAGTATIVTSPANCYTEASGNVVGEPNPLIGPTVSTQVGVGTLAAGTYYTVIAYSDATGTTFYSPETVTILAAQGSLIVSAPLKQPNGATIYKVFIGSTSGGETLQQTVTVSPGSWPNYTQSTSLSAGAALPASNTTVCTILFNDQLTPSFTGYMVTLSNQNGSAISGYPQKWYLYGGASGTINLSNGTPWFSGVVVYPQAIVTSPAANGSQSISGPLSLGAYSFTAGAATLGSIDGWLWVDGTQNTTFAGTLAKVPVNGGEVRIPPDYSETYTSTINVGSSTHPNQAVLGGNSTLTCNVTGGASDCVDIHNGSTFRGQTTGSTATRTGGSVLNLAATANVVNVIGAPEGANLGGQAFFGLENLQIDNASGGTVSGAYVNLAGVLGLSSIKNVLVSQCRGKAFNVTSTANAVSGPLTLDNDWADCAFNANGQPLLITINTAKSQVGISALGGAYVNPGAGIPIITIDGKNTGNVLRSTLLQNNYLEDFTNNNNIGVKVVDAGGTTIIGGESSLSGAGETGIDLSEVTPGNLKSVAIFNYHCVGAAITCINNHITGTTLGGSSAYVPLYLYGGSNGTQPSEPVTFEDLEFDINKLSGKTIFRFVKDATLTIRNWADATETVSIDSGATVAQISRIALRDQGIDKYYVQKDGSNNFSIRDVANSITKFQFAPNGITNLDAGNGANEIRFNADTNAGTSGIAVYSGGASPTLAAQINGTGNLSNYASVATADYGVAAIQGTPQHLTGQVGNLGATNLYAAAPPAGVYRVCFDAFTTTSGTGTTMTVSIGWTDAGGAKTFTSATWALNSLTITGYVDGCKIINSSGAANITVSTTGTIGTSAFAIDAMAERMK